MRDLTDPAYGPHAIQLIVDDILTAVGERWPGPLRVHRGEHVVDVADNYDRLGYGAEAKARDARYSRYVGAGRMLRSQTSALVPGGLRAMARAGMDTAILACPGMVYRRDVIDRLHTGTPHQLDIWPIAARRCEPRRLGGRGLAVILGGAGPAEVEARLRLGVGRLNNATAGGGVGSERARHGGEPARRPGQGQRSGPGMVPRGTTKSLTFGSSLTSR